MKFWFRLLREEEGTTSVEYCVMLFLIITACIVAITAIGGSSNGLWGKNSTRLETYLQ